MTAPLRGARKAAIALLSLHEDVATAVLARLSEPEVRQLRLEVEALDDVPDAQVVQVLDELTRNVASPLAMARAAGPAYLRRLAQRAFGEERAGQWLAAPSPPELEPIDLLRGARVADLAALLAEEHPQVAAIVLTQLPSAHAAKVVAAMHGELATEVLARLAELEEIPARAAAEASQALVRALEAAGALANLEARAAFDGLAFTAKVARELEPLRGRELLEQLSSRDRTIATRLHSALIALEAAGQGPAPRQRGAS